MTSGQGGQDPQQGQPPQEQPGWQAPPGQGWAQQPPPDPGWQQPPAGQGWQAPQQGWQAPPQGWQQGPPQGWQQGPPPYGYAAAPSAPGGYFSQEAPERPTTVRVGLGALIATLILGLIASLVQFSDVDGLVAEQVAVANDPAVTEDIVRVGVVVGSVIGLLVVALQALFIWLAWKGRNWARIVLCVLGGLSVVLGLAGLGVAGAGSGFLDALSVFSLLLTLVGVVALLLRPSTEWYRAMTARRQVGLR
ncbi:hypothetical protein [Geodermatophilus sp. DSM 44513]|uniref:hypothetical protein n=1 Tax=Geodermatophilus sp. DSM 44513 TaxID=1528104 RepID=UPI001283F936|nr:hypothetical protein [Geodermatophilus sp. DSM 44513]WNV75346.1 hypothetical protein RTG05_20585 [Geodermatophilus sp. DSM 44513]